MTTYHYICLSGKHFIIYNLFKFNSNHQIIQIANSFIGLLDRLLLYQL